MLNGGRFVNKEEVNNFAWYLLFQAVQKKAPFVSGSFLIEDPGYKVFKALSPLAYSRKFGKTDVKKATHTNGEDVLHPELGKKVDKHFEKSIYNKNTFGSTHYIEMVSLCVGLVCGASVLGSAGCSLYFASSVDVNCVLPC
jgi:hypothetical protein